MANSIKARVLPSIFLLPLFLSSAPFSAAYHAGDLGADLDELSQVEIDALVDLHNEGRSNVEPEASNMNRVVRNRIKDNFFFYWKLNSNL